MNQAKLFIQFISSAMLLSVGVQTALSADELQTEFSKGLQALDKDNLKTARETFLSILSGSPGLHRARLELARAYYMSMDYEQAREQAQKVLDDPNTPASVQATVLAFMAQIDKDEQSRQVRHKFTPSIYLGFMHDTNVTLGPENEVVDFAGTLNDAALEKDDTAFVITPSVTHTFNPDKRFQFGEHSGYFLWQSQASLYHREYFDEDESNVTVLGLSTGPAWVVPRHWRAGIGVAADRIWFGGSPLALFTSLSPNITWQLGDNTELALNGTLTDRDYHKSSDSSRDGLYRSLGASVGQYMNDRKMAVRLGGRAFDFDADSDRFTNDGWEVFVSGVVQVWTNGSLYARAGFQSYEFDGREPLATESRDDEETRLTVGFRHNIKSGALNKWTLSGSWSRTDNESNLPIYDYTRDQYNLGLSRSF
ncbi:MAG: hypothetical protein V3W04_13680 [Gammaproteobacteria bacterium]